MFQMTRFFKNFHYHGPEFEKKKSLKLCHQWGKISRDLKTAKLASAYLTPLVAEFHSVSIKILDIYVTTIINEN